MVSKKPISLVVTLLFLIINCVYTTLTLEMCYKLDLILILVLPIHTDVC